MCAVCLNSTQKIYGNPQTPGSKHGRLKGFYVNKPFGEQEYTFVYHSDVRIYINAPPVTDWDGAKKTKVVLFALPNGNTIEQTAGMLTTPVDDWHFGIQHIAAQTRFLRRKISDENLVVIYLEAAQRSWPLWKKSNPDFLTIIPQIVDSLKNMFAAYHPYVVLNGHSGGGSFIFGYLESQARIPNSVERICFLDSNYNYEDKFGEKIANWLAASNDHFLSVIAYNDSIALYKGKPFVSRTGGTWYRSKMMIRYLSTRFSFISDTTENFFKCVAKSGNIQFVLKKNPAREIYHTVQVEKNGFIHTMLTGTAMEEKDYEYYGAPVYSAFIDGMILEIKPLNIPPRSVNAVSGSDFMRSVENLPRGDREVAILREISGGNIPDFLRKLVRVNSWFDDAEGNQHSVVYEVMPDYLAIGSNEDFCRIPMQPHTAQKLADLFGASLPSRKLVDDVYKHAVVKVAPVSYYPVGNANELVTKFVEHNRAIEQQGRELDELNAQWYEYDTYWSSIQQQRPEIDAKIEAFNQKVMAARKG